MSGFEVNTTMLSKAGARVTEAGERGQAVDLAVVLATVPSALMGSQTERVAPVTADALQGALRQWATAAQAHGYNLTASAQTYEANDEAAVAQFSWVAP
jgi:hypothetical protein